MKTIKAVTKAHCLGFFLILFLLPLTTFAGIRDERSSEIQAQYTLVLGTGISLAYNLGNHLAFGATYYAASIEGEGDNTDNNEKVKADFSTTELFLRLYPFEGAGLYLSGASVLRNWKITVEGYDTGIGDTSTPGNYKLTAEWPNTGYSYGLGYNWIAKFGLSWGVFIGALSGGEPTLKGETDAAVPQSEVDKQVDQVAEDEKFGEKYNTVTLVRLSIGYNF